MYSKKKGKLNINHMKSNFLNPLNLKMKTIILLQLFVLSYFLYSKFKLQLTKTNTLIYISHFTALILYSYFQINIYLDRLINNPIDNNGHKIYSRYILLLLIIIFVIIPIVYIYQIG